MFGRRLMLAAVLAIASAAACSHDPDAARLNYLASGDAYFAKKQYKEASIEYRNAIQQNPMWGPSRFKLAETYRELGDHQSAYREYIRAADIMPNNGTAQVRAAQYLLAAGRVDEARARVGRALELNPNDVDALIVKGAALAQMKNIDSAVAQVLQAIEVDPSRPGSYASLGSLEAARGDLVEAEKAFKKALEVDPGSLSAKLTLANFYWTTGRTQDAERLLKEAGAAFPTDADTNRGLAIVLAETNRGADAEKYLRVAADVAHDSAARLTLAAYYARNKKPAEAMRLLDAVAAEDPGSAAMARALKAQLQYNAGDLEAAHKTLDELLEREPANSVALVAKGRFLVREGKIDEALATATTATKYDPASVDAHWLLGRIQMMRRDPAAVETLKRAATLNPSFWPAKLDLAQAQYRMGLYADAVTTTQEVLQVQPRNADAILLRSRALLAKGDAALVESDLEALARAFPASPEVHAQLGTAYLARRKYDDARAASERALAQDDRQQEALTTLVTLDLAQKQPQRAIARIEALTRKYPEDAPVWELAGRAYATIGDDKQSEIALRKAMDLDPSRMQVYFLLSQLYARQNRLAAALKELDRLEQLNPKAVGPSTLAGMLLDAQGRAEEAKERYRRALERNPRAAVAANNLAWHYADEDENLDEALRLAQVANAQLPGEAGVIDTLGWVYYKRQLPTLAIPAFRASIEKDPRNPYYHYRLGLAFYRTGARDQAREALAKAVALDPNFQGADDARKKLRVLQ
jgi:tetratricopeptide (TPR) repeat protein